MSEENNAQIEGLLARIRAGDSAATSQLLDIAYGELRGLAHSIATSTHGDHTLQPTALVNEVCMRLLRSPAQEWNDKQHFLRVAAKAMRNLLIDHARAGRANKRGAGIARVSLELAADHARRQDVDLIALDESLTKLAAMDNRLSQVFELRFLVGLSVETTAEVLDVSARTVELDTRLIRAWLHRELFG